MGAVNTAGAMDESSKDSGSMARSNRPSLKAPDVYIGWFYLSCRFTQCTQSLKRLDCLGKGSHFLKFYVEGNYRSGEEGHESAIVEV